MPDFFEFPCTKENAYCVAIGIKPCKSKTNERRFGIIDDISEESQPAFIQEYREEEWNVTVEKVGNQHYTVNFKAVDKCVVFPPPPGNIPNKICEGILYFNDWIIFVEIKDNTRTGYAENAKAQLSRSIQVFSQSQKEFPAYRIRKAYISNDSKPKAADFSIVEKDKFADENFGFELYRELIIKLP